MAKWPKDNQSALISFYGDPGSSGANGVANQLIRVVPPFQMFYDGKPLKSVSFHKKAAPALTAALTKVWDYYGHDQKTIDKLGISKTAGTFNPRKIRGSATKWSNHAYGAAIDINAEQNGFNVAGNIPLVMIAAFKSEGARWGGDYKGRKDPMHFEFCESGEPSQTFEQWLDHYGIHKPLSLLEAPTEDVDKPTAGLEFADGGDSGNPETPEADDTDLHDVETPPTGIVTTGTIEAPAATVVNAELSEKANRPVTVSTIPVDEKVRAVQKLLRMKGFYQVGEADGKLGEDTKDAIMAFRRRNNLPISTEIDDQLITALSTADKKPVTESRALATASTLSNTNVGIQAAVRNKLAGLWATIVSGVMAAITAISSTFQDVWDSNLFHTLRGMAGSVPAWVWFGLAAAAAFAIYWNAKRGIVADVDAHREGRSL